MTPRPSRCRCGIACAAGIALGIIDSLIQYVSALSWFPTSGGIAVPGVQELVAFVIIIGAMFLRGGRLPGRGDLIEQRLPLAPRPRNLVPTAVVVGLVCAVGLVVLPYDFREALINTLIGTVMALSLVVLTGFVGQISVVQLTLAGVAGFVISHFAVNFGIGFPLAPIIGTAVAVLLGMITAVSALRVRGVALAVVTLAAAVAIQNFGFLNPTWGGGQAGSPVPEPHLLGLDLGPRSAFRGLDGNLPSPVFGWVVLVITLALCVLVGAVRRGDLGRRMLAVRSNERAAAAASINPRNVKLAAVRHQRAGGGDGGVAVRHNFGSVSADRFDAFTALSLIAFAYAGGITLISGAAFAGLISTQALFPYALDKWFGLSGTWFLLFGGVILIVTLIQNPEGVAGAFHRRTRRRPMFSPELPEAAARAPVAVTSSPPRGEPDPPGPPVLSVPGLSVAFGGVHALTDVDLQVGEGELVGLIGPNGAGKTTFIDAITGFVRCSGRVELDGRDVGGARPTSAPGSGSRAPGRAPTCSTTSTSARTSRWRSVTAAAWCPCPTVGVTRSTPPCRRWGSSRSPPPCPQSCRRDSASSSGSPGPSSAGHACCAWTSPRPASTPRRAGCSASACASSATAGCRRCSSTTTWGSC